MAEKADKIEAQLGDIDESDDIPDTVLNEFVENTQDFFDTYVTSRVEMKTLQEMNEEEAKENAEKRKRRRRRLGENVPEDIQGLMKMANDEYLNGNFLRATSFAQEAIDIEPQAAEPYNILAMIAEDNDSLDVALTFLVKAAERSTDSAELWSECARISKQLGKLAATVGYLKKAAKSNPDDVVPLMELYDVLNTSVNDSRSLMWTLQELTNRRPLESKYARELAEYLHQSGQTLKALEVLRNSVEAQLNEGAEVNLENANLLASSYLGEGMNEEVITLDSKIATAPPDFRVMAAIANIRMDKWDRAKELLVPFSRCQPSLYKDAYEFLTEELMKAEFFREAVEWLQRMNDDGMECREDIAYCLVSCHCNEQAVEVLKSLILDCPSLPRPGFLFYQLMTDLGREAEAIEWMEQNCPEGRQNDTMILKRAVMAYDQGNVEMYMEMATPLICRTLYDVYKLKLLSKESKLVEGILGITSPEKMRPFLMKVLRYRRFCTETYPVEEKQFYHLATSCLAILHAERHLEEAFVLAGLLVICSEKLERREAFDVMFTFALIAFSLGDGAAACSIMRAVLLENNKNELVWEFFNVFLQKTPEEEVYAHKFLLRTLAKLPDCLPLQLMLGNHSQSTVWFDHAITQYLNVYRERPDEPIVSLLLAAAYLSKAYVRTQKNPRKSILCSYAAIRRYCKAREDDFPAEINYNMGKFFQALGMYPHAEQMYRKVLEAPVDYECLATDSTAHEERYSLKCDAAHNLCLMLQESNPAEARRVARKYLTF